MFNTGVLVCHPSSVAAVPGMADAKQQLLGCLPPDNEQLCPPDCVLVSEDGTEMPAHQSFVYLNSEELGKMLAVAMPDDKGSRRLQVSCCVFATNACPPSSLLPVLCAASKHECNARLSRGSAQLCMMLLLQTQDSSESLALLLEELYGSMKVSCKSVVCSGTVLPLLLIADKYNVKTTLSRCTVWLNSLDSKSLRDSLLATSSERGKGTCYICMR